MQELHSLIPKVAALITKQSSLVSSEAAVTKIEIRFLSFGRRDMTIRRPCTQAKAAGVVLRRQAIRRRWSQR
jgi:hypothetical protein